MLLSKEELDDGFGRFRDPASDVGAASFLFIDWFEALLLSVLDADVLEFNKGDTAVFRRSSSCK